jgi:hypothetical protein
MISTKTDTPYTGASGMLLHKIRKFTIENLKTSLLLESLVLIGPRYQFLVVLSGYGADLAVSVVSFMASSM